MHIAKLGLWSFRLIILLNLCLLVPYVLAWDYFGYQHLSSHHRHPSDIIAFFQNNFHVLIAASALIAGLISLLKPGRVWVLSLWHLLVIMVFYFLFAWVSWDEHQFDKAIGANRGALETFIISNVMIALNLSAFCILSWTALKARRQSKVLNP